MPYMEERCRAGKIIEICKYHTARWNCKGGHRKKKDTPTIEAQIKVNLRLAAKKLRRLLAANFVDGDILLTLDYKKELRPGSSTEMQDDMKAFLKELRRAYKEAGLILKYVYVKELGPRGGAHIHMVLNYCDRLPDIIRNAWHKGKFHMELLNTDGEYSRLAEYFIKYANTTAETEGKQIGKKYYPSNGLKQPEVEKRVIKRVNTYYENIREEEGYYLIKDSVLSGTTKDGYDYFSYFLHQKKDYRKDAEAVRMKHVNIYIHKTQKSPRRQDGAGCYVLETETKKGMETRKGFVELKNETANSAELILITEALRRLNKKCRLTIYTEAGQVGAAMESGWIERWKENGWKTERGTPIHDMEKWDEMSSLLAGHEYEFKTGTHPYLAWMTWAVEKMKGETECLKNSEILTVQRN